MISAGIHKAKLVGHAISETKDGNPQAVIVFSVESDGKSEIVTYFGSLTHEKVIPHTLKALIICGLKGSNPAGFLELGKEVMLTIEHQEYKGKTQAQVRWINPVAATKRAIPKDLAMSKLAALEGAVMLARQNLGIDTSEEIPF